MKIHATHNLYSLYNRQLWSPKREVHRFFLAHVKNTDVSCCLSETKFSFGYIDMLAFIYGEPGLATGWTTEGSEFESEAR
jgi:hypothetical protein